MLDVYVCEDHKEQRKMVVNYVETAIMVQEYDMKLIIETDDPKEIINAVKKSENMGLYFLDTHLHACINGFVLAQKIREYDPRGFIVFITSHLEMSILTFQYKIEALDFILKFHPQQLRNRICECMEYVAQKYSKITRGNKKVISILTHGHTVMLEYDKIMFFETSVNEHKLIVHMENKCIEFYGTMKEIEDEVGEDFIRCHRAYLVNKKNIKIINYEERYIIMKTKDICPISHRMISQIKKLR